MKRFTIAVALLATLSFVGSVQALGPAPPGTAVGVYNSSSGLWFVSVNDVVNWYIESPLGLLSGPDDAASVLPLAGGEVTDNDFSVGETTGFSSMTYDVSLGNLAGIGAQDNFTIHWNSELGVPLGSGLVQITPEPTTLALAGIGLIGLLASRRRRVA